MNWLTWDKQVYDLADLDRQVSELVDLGQAGL